MSDAGRIPTDHGTPVNRVALAVGRTVGRYEIVGILGQGGFGITYRARDTQLAREVAIKEYLPAALAIRQDGTTVLPRSTEVADDFAWGRERFVAEGRTLATLDEAPAVVRVHDFLEANGTAYIVMELLRGETLERRVMLAGPLRPPELDRLLWPLLAGLQKVHEAGFLHRDIKPANILVGTNGTPVLIDFGASRAAMAARTQSMTTVFTPGYAAPEQFASARQGPWTDIYGLAATFHYAITGKAPPGTFDRLIVDQYERLAHLQPPGFGLGVLLGIDAGLCLAASERPQTIVAWRVLLGRQESPGEKTVLMARLPPVPQVVRAPRRTRWIAAGTALTLLLAAGAYYVLAPLPRPPAVATASDVKPAPLQIDAPRPKTEGEAPNRTAGEDAKRKRAQDIGEKKRLEDEARQKVEADAQARRLAEDEARAHTERSPPSAFDGTYGGSLTETTTTSMSASRIVAARLSLAGSTISGEIIYPHCGASTASMAVSPGGEISGAIRIPDAMACLPVNGTASGRVTAQGIQLELRGVGTVARGNLIKGGPAPSAVAASTGGAFDGAYAGSLANSSTSAGQAGLRLLGANLHISGNRLTGQLIHPTCGPSPVSLPVDSSGAISGTVQVPEPIVCSLNDATLSGRVSARALTLDIRGVTMSAHGSLARRAP